MQNQRHEVHQKEDAESGWTQGKFENVQRTHRQGRCINRHSREQALSILESTREEDEAEEPTHVFDQSDNGKWLREEAVVDSGAVECVTSKKRMPHLRAEETPESRRGETCTCAGGNEIKKEGKVTVNWRTDLGTIKRGIFKVGLVSRALISVDRLQETGHDVIFTKDKPRIVNLRTGEVMPLRTGGGMLVLDMWIWVPTSRTKTEGCSDFARQR